MARDPKQECSSSDAIEIKLNKVLSAIFVELLFTLIDDTNDQRQSTGYRINMMMPSKFLIEDNTKDF